jgi:hypothetical protein
VGGTSSPGNVLSQPRWLRGNALQEVHLSWGGSTPGTVLWLRGNALQEVHLSWEREYPRQCAVAAGTALQEYYSGVGSRGCEQL